MPPKTVRVEIDDSGVPIRIFRNDKAWLSVPDNRIVVMLRSEAVGTIRRTVYDRTLNDDGFHECEHCGRYIDWDSFEMNEIVFKGKGGEVSTTNCEALCRPCHQTGPDAVHKDRRWQTARISE